MDKRRILYISQEISPYTPAAPLAAFSKELPESLLAAGAEVRTFMPRYGLINERRNQLHEVIRLSGLNIPIDDTDHPLIIKVATLQPSRMQVYFIDNDDYFIRHSARGLETDDLPDDNDERAIFFVRGVLETVRKLRWAPSVIHCTGWITALAPLYIRRLYADDPTFADTRIVFSLFDRSLPADLSPRFADKLMLDGFSPADLEPLAGATDHDALSRLAIAHSDAVAVSSEGVSPALIDFARAANKPLLPFPGADNHTAYHHFYSTL